MNYQCYKLFIEDFKAHPMFLDLLLKYYQVVIIRQVYTKHYGTTADQSVFILLIKSLLSFYFRNKSVDEKLENKCSELHL